MTERKCDNCKWALGYPAAGKEPHRPSIHWFWSWFESGADCVVHDIWADEAERHEKMIACSRYPKIVMKAKTSLCGEFEVKL